MTASAYDAKIDGIYYYLYKDAKTAEVTEGDNVYTGDIVIPESISYDGEKYNVTGIRQHAFSSSKITSIIIPESITSLSSWTFDYCDSLTTITLPDGLTSIGEYCFNGSGITTITLPLSLKRIEKRAFAYCNDLRKVIFNCRQLETADFSFTHITEVEIGEYAEDVLSPVGFPYSTVQTLKVDPKNTKYDSRNNCNAIIETNTNKLLAGCTTTIIPESVTSIGDYAFYGCRGLTSIQLPDGLTTISQYAFFESGLLSIEIPQSVDSVGVGAFNSCPWYDEQPDGPVYLGSVVICKNPSNLDENAEIVIKEGVKRISDDAFMSCTAKSIILPNSLEIIGGDAFSGALLDSIRIPDNVHTIGAMAFALSKLKKVTLPKSLREAGSSIFMQCENLVSAIIPDGIIAIPDYLFIECTSLTSITLPNSVKIINENAFSGCENLKSITLGNSIERIGELSFAHCKNLESVTLPNSVACIGKYAFANCEELDSINIPNSVASIEYGAFSSCRDLKSICFSEDANISSNLTSIGDNAFSFCESLLSISLPKSVTSVGNEAFWNCDSLQSVTIVGDKIDFGSAVFKGCTNIKEFTYMSSSPWVSYSDFFPESIYETAILYVPLQFVDTYKKTYPWQRFKQIVGLSDTTLELICMADNKNVTADVTIKWSNIDDETIGHGSIINVYPGQQLYYTVLLEEELGRKYYEIINEPCVGANTDSTIVCHLRRIDDVSISGRVSVEDIDEKTISVRVKQMLNGKYEEVFTTQTNNYGEFSLDAYDDDTDLIISCDGYQDAVIHRSSFNGNGDVGIISLKPISGFVIPVNIDYTSATSEGNKMKEDLLPGGLYDLQLTLWNGSTDNEITDFSVQYNGTLIIHSGANAWDWISITAKSKQQLLTEATTEFNLDENGNGNIELIFAELGGVSATYSESGNSGTAGYLYDSNGNLVAKGIYNGETLQLKHAPEGSYTLISIGQSALLSNISNLSKLTELNLAEGKDYLRNQLEINNGVITEVSVGSIPKLNESLFLFDGSLLADKSSVVVGRYVTLYPKVNIDEELYKKVNDVYLTIDIPEGCELIDNTVFVDRKEQTYTKDGNTLSLHLTKEQAQGDIALCVTPTDAKIYNFSAYVSFDKEITGPRLIGVVQVDGEALSLRVPSITAYKTVIVSGVASPNSEVKIYDGDVKIGEAESKGDGTWSTQCELYNAYNLSIHDIIAKARTQEGWTLTSEMKSVEYDRECIEPTTVSMTFYNGFHDENITVDFDLMNGTTSKKHYDFYKETDFTFLAKFTKNDPELIDDVNFMVKASDGTIRILPALFDSKQQAWVATSRYNYDKLPQNVTVDYVCLREETDEEREESLDDLSKEMAVTANHIVNSILENTEMDLIEDEEDHAVMNCYFKDADTSVNYRIELIYYEEAEQMMNEKQFFYIWDDEGDIGYYTDIFKDSIIVTAVDLVERVAFQMTLYDPYASSYAKADKMPSMKKAKYQWLEKLGDYFKQDFSKWKKEGGLGSLVGIIDGVDYLLSKRDYDSMAKKLEHYRDKLRVAEEKTMNMIVAKCPEGEFRLSQNQRDRYFKRWSELNLQWGLFQNVYEDYLEKYQVALAKNVAANSLLSILWGPAGVGVKAAGKGGAVFIAEHSTKLLSGMAQKKLIKNVTAAKAAKSIKNFCKRFIASITTQNEKKLTFYSALGCEAQTAILGLASKFLHETDFKAVRDELKSWSSKQSKWILDYHRSLNKEIQSQYGQCKKYEPETRKVTDPWQETFNENNDDNTITFTTPPVEPILDPSGFVYEAVLSNRLPGVTTTVYQKQGGNAVKWNAENYSQQNPLVTDEAGFYRWDVPQGEWQVKYEKDGYETCYSEWLPVPPPQLDVNVGMKQTTPPTVKQMRGMESGITIEMSKYMLPAGMNKENITVKKEGSTISGKIEMMDSEQSPTADDVFVSKVKFVPDNAFYAGDEVYVTVKGNVESYCGVAMGADHTQKVVIEPEITAIVIDSLLTIPYGGTKTVEVLVMPKEVSAGKVLNARLSSNLITSLGNEHITIDENGLATLTLNGDLPGGAQLTLTMDNTDVSAQSRIKVDVEYEVASTPTSSIRNGDQVGKGTMLTLECATEGATIYYTLDGSCPCNEDTRIRYTGPFALPEGVVTVKAVAVAEYLYDSDVATFIYQVSSQTGIDTPTAESTSFKAAYRDGAIVIDDAEGAECQVYDMAGRELNAKKQLQVHDALPVTKADTYVVYLKWGNGKTAVRKIARR